MNSQGQFYPHETNDEHKENNNIYATDDKRMSKTLRDKSENAVMQK